MTESAKRNLDSITDGEKRLILWAEIGALLHDIGKLSDIFLEYRTRWQDNLDVMPSEAAAFFGAKWDYTNDPHDPHIASSKKFLDFDEEYGVLKEFPDLAKFFKSKSFKDLLEGFPIDISIKDLIDEHTNENAKHLLKILMVSDQKDTAENRNDPLKCCEQDSLPVKKSSPFGCESEQSSSPEASRRKLYSDLDNLLPDYLAALKEAEAFSSLLGKTMPLRENVLQAFKNAYSNGISDTCRPANDVSLWDHAYGTACLFKAFVAHVAYTCDLSDPSMSLKEKFRGVEEYGATEFRRGRFALLGFGWDGLSYIEKGEKIGDSVGRARILEELKQELRSLVEVRYCLGNHVYADENGICFLIPQLKGGEGTGLDYPPELEKLINEARSKAQAVACGELPIYSMATPTTEYLNGIVSLIDNLRKKWSVPWNHEQASSAFKGWHNSKEMVVCPVCRLRPTRDRQSAVCKQCGDIRRSARTGRSSEETVFTGEIVGEKSENLSRKAALIVGRFELREWLNGRMLYSIFVKEGKMLEREANRIPEMQGLESKSDFTELCDAAKRIKEAVAEHKKKTGSDQADHSFIDGAVQCMAGERSSAWGDSSLKAFRKLYFPYLDQARIESLKGFLNTLGADVYDHDTINLANFLCTQNHTPSRLLAVWNETKAFFEDIHSRLPGFMEERGFFLKHRASLVFREGASIPLRIKQWEMGGVVELSLEGGERIEVVRADNKILTVNNPFSSGLVRKFQGRKVVLVEGESIGGDGSKAIPVDWVIDRIEDGGEGYFPYRSLLVSPIVFMTVVPGGAALELAQEISAKYEKHFCKVKGRLPFSLGLIFFQEHTPMFAVLDAGKRMIRNFEQLHASPPVAFKVTESSSQAPSPSFLLKQIDGPVAEFPAQFTANVTDDPHYPYVPLKPLVKTAGKPQGAFPQPEERASFFPTLAGNLLHFSKVHPGDLILVRPNYFDILFLDSTTRRFDVLLAPGQLKRPGSGPHTGIFPCCLDELPEIMGLWRILERSRISDTGLRGIESLLASKLGEWAEKGGDAHLREDEVWRRMVRSTLARSFPLDKVRTSVERAVLSGLFFDVMEVYLRILKKRVANTREETQCQITMVS